MREQNNNPNNSDRKDKKLISKLIAHRIEKGSKKKVSELKKQYSEERLFYIALKYVTTTKKALCKALDINIDNACRYKRNFEKHGRLVQSIDEVKCPYTGFKAHLISTNPREFNWLQKSNSNQLNLFE